MVSVPWPHGCGPGRPAMRSRHGATLTLLGARARGLLAEPALEPGHAAAGVEDLLLAGVERVAARADVGVDDAVLSRAARGEGLPAGAGDLGHDVVRVDTRLHCVLLPRAVAGSPGRGCRRGVNRYRTVDG